MTCKADSVTLEAGTSQSECFPDLVRILKNHSPNDSGVPSVIRLVVPYGYNICQRGEYLPASELENIHFDNDATRVAYLRTLEKKPIFLVTKGVFEVYTQQKIDGVFRSHTNTVLGTGSAFALFENIAGLEARKKWSIAAGLQSFIVTNAIGTNKHWEKVHPDSVDSKDLKLESSSRFSFCNLLRNTPADVWCAEVLIVSLEEIKDPCTRVLMNNYFQYMTVTQLSSVIRQNISVGFSEDIVKPLDEEELFFQYLDGVVDGHIPILQHCGLASDEDFPVSKLRKLLGDYMSAAGAPSGSTVDVLAPRLMKAQGDIGFHFNKVFQRYPLKADVDLKRGFHNSARRHGAQSCSQVPVRNSDFARTIMGEEALNVPATMHFTEYNYEAPSGKSAMVRFFELDKNSYKSLNPSAPAQQNTHVLPMKHIFEFVSVPDEGGNAKPRGPVEYKWRPYLSFALRVDF